MKNKLDTIVKLLRDSELSSYKIAQNTGISDQTIQNYRDGKTRPKGSNLIILSKYLGLDIGENESAPYNEIKPKLYKTHIAVKLVNIKARAGYCQAYYSEEYLKDLPTVLIEADENYRGNYLAFEVDGDSMEPEYLPGDVVVCREISRDLWQHTLHFKDWDFVIAHGTNGIMLKEIIAHDVGTGDIICHSINPEKADFVLNLREVAFLYNVVEHRRSGKSKRKNR